MSRALRSTVSDLLGEPRLRGADLLAALEEAGRVHGAEPFEVCLAMLPVPRRAPGEPRQVVAGIETHRSGLEQRLGRDPGFVVAAIDFLQGAYGRAWHRATPAGARASAHDARGREPAGSFEEGLCAELRRCRRSRRPLSLILLVPEQDPGREVLDRAEVALAEALRDSDRLGRLVPPAFAIVLPESDGAAAARAAARLGRIAARAAAASFRCGLSVAGAEENDGEALLSAARRALEHEPIDPEAGPFTERRRHRRNPAPGVRARLLRDESTRDTEILDLSSVGARVRDGEAPEGTAVRLSLLGPSPRADAATLPARVASRRAAPDGGQAVLIFDEGDPGLAELATLLSGLPRGPREGRS
jgi:hypothetical protein